jgi:predicted RNA methylase
MQDTGKFRSNDKDKFYTKPSVAITCVAELAKHAVGTWIEPSAGSGAFVDAAKRSVVAMDIEPARDGITQQDFLTWASPYTNCTVFGNPPFGRQATLARKFIKHAGSFADVIGFILPRSFMKPSMQRAFPLAFHLVHESPVDANAFLVNGVAYNVPCVFQIWKRMETQRSIPVEADIMWMYVKKSEPHDIAIRRVGVYAGKCMRPDDSLSIQSHYFIKLPDDTDIDATIEHVCKNKFPSNTTGPRSLSKGEINSVLADCVGAVPTP